MRLQAIIIQHGPQLLLPAMVAENRSARVVGEFIKAAVKIKNERCRILICYNGSPWSGCSWLLLQMDLRVTADWGLYSFYTNYFLELLSAAGSMKI